MIQLSAVTIQMSLLPLTRLHLTIGSFLGRLTLLVDPHQLFQVNILKATLNV